MGRLAPARLQALAGAYRDTRTGALLRVTASEGTLRVGGATLFPISATRFVSAGADVTLDFEGSVLADGRPAAVLDRPDHPHVRIEPVAAVDPTAAELAAYLGAYRSDEAEATYRVEVTDGRLALVDRWGETTPLNPLYRDVFGIGGLTVVFGRDVSGKVNGLTWSESRVWGLRFERVGGS
jgi:hypothetical protein